MTKTVAENTGRVPATQVKKKGPRTARGKAASSKNGRKHGLTSKDAVHPDESAKEFEHFRDEIFSNLKPAGPIKVQLVVRIVMWLWRLRRIYWIETSDFKQACVARF